MSSRRRGFTLVELLVVIGVIALLIAILLPTLSKARENAIRAKCASNIRQWGQGLHMYANDNKGFFPYNGEALGGAAKPLPNCPVGGADLSWNSTIVQQFWATYLMPNKNLRDRGRDNVLFCPSQTWHREEQNDATLAGGLMGYFYLPHRHLVGTVVPVNMDYKPAGEGWVSKKKFSGEFKLAPIMSDMQQYDSGTQSWAHYSSHNRNQTPSGGNFLFEDGHVKWFNFDEIEVGATLGGWSCNYKIKIF